MQKLRYPLSLPALAMNGLQFQFGAELIRGEAILRLDREDTCLDLYEH